MIDQNKIASRIARIFFGFEMTESEWKEYKKQHPSADKKNHKIVKDSAHPSGKSEGTRPGQPYTGLKNKKPYSAPTTSNHVKLDKNNLVKVLKEGSFSIVSAGPNPNDPDEAKAGYGEEFFIKRHEELRKELESKNLKYTEVLGKYGGKEMSFLVLHDEGVLQQTPPVSVMVHHKNDAATKKIVEKIGQKFNQHSVLHADGGRNTIHFTTGNLANKECGGTGWNLADDAKDYFTQLLGSRSRTKFQLNIQECFSKGML
jgi:hypothetical protein